MRIGVISDTHDYLDPRVSAIFAGVDHILHAGDIGRPRIILELEQIARVSAVMGNTDDAGFHYPLTVVVELDGRRFLVHHIVRPEELTDALRDRITRDRADVVVFGHTHQPFCQTLERRLFFNPGYAGRSRFRMERSVAILHTSKTELRTEYVQL